MRKPWGATLLLNERLEGKEENTYITDKGTKIQADIEFNCTGLQPNTAFLTKHFPEHLDEGKRIKVNQYLQLSSYENIFAIGDCTNVKEEKLAINAKRHATLVVTNIRRLERQSELHPYKISKLFTSLISCGRSHAIMATPWFAINGLMPAQFKSMEVPMLMKTLTWSYPQFFWEFY
jgi:NADH dehydrogenase FAD-containing subunit